MVDLKINAVVNDKKKPCTQNIDSLWKLPNQVYKVLLQNQPFSVLFLMSTFFDKDFFGDPFWPNDFGFDANRLQGPEVPPLSSANKPPQNQEPNENSCNSISCLLEYQDNQEMQKSFLANERKMLYSNFKHEEITYLEDNKKASEFLQGELESAEKLSENSLSEDSHDINLIKEAQMKFDQELQEELFQSKQVNQSQIQNYSSMNSESQEEYEPQNMRENRFCNRMGKKYKLRKPKVKIEYNQCKIQEEQMISQILKESFNTENPSKRIRFMSQIDKKIMKKLGIDDSESQGVKEKPKQHKAISQRTNQGLVKKDLSDKYRTQKYKILTESQKEYLVYLSTLSTTCQVSRRFNISVNNICRWKKGTKRKAGAGRKIVNMELQEKVIEYVKEVIAEGIPFTRKQIQMTAMKLSDDPNFKASKGWFERFFNRNIQIFTKSSSYNHK